jgi:hypothetical protein
VFNDVRQCSEQHLLGSVYPPERNAGQCEALAPSADDPAELTHNYSRERDLFSQGPGLCQWRGGVSGRRYSHGGRGGAMAACLRPSRDISLQVKFKRRHVTKGVRALKEGSNAFGAA